MDFSKKAFFDHHTHLLDPDMVELTKKDFVMRFLHGFQDTEPWDKEPIPHIPMDTPLIGRSTTSAIWVWSK